MNAWNRGATWEIGQRGVRLFELQLRAFEAERRENDRGEGFETIVERAVNAITRARRRTSMR